MGKKLNLVGQKFGMLTVLQDAGRQPNPKNTNKLWLCECECGTQIKVQAGHLRSGHTKKCRNCKTIKHGLCKHPLYAVWVAMIQRITNPNNDRYYMYGGAGITVCEEWKNDFYSFYSWSIENGYKKGLSIDRIDGKKGYNPQNCRYADIFQQQNNIKSNVPLEVDGVIKNCREWCRIYNMHHATVLYRIRTKGWTAKEALETPPQYRKKGGTIYGLDC